MIRGLVLVAALAACASAPAPREPFSTTALLIDAQGYVASRYEPHELPAALIADLTAQDFQCHHSATMSECSSARCTRSRHASMSLLSRSMLKS